MVDASASDFGNQAFSFTGHQQLPFSEGSVWAVEGGGNTLVYAGVDGGIASMLIIVQGVTGLTAADFVL
jgi:hypothetical protein